MKISPVVAGVIIVIFALAAGFVGYRMFLTQPPPRKPIGPVGGMMGAPSTPKAAPAGSRKPAKPH